jgi:hypothetical protein
MNSKQEKKRRRLTRKIYRETINSLAAYALRREIWRPAKARDRLGVLAIVEGTAVAVLLILSMHGGVK